MRKTTFLAAFAAMTALLALSTPASAGELTYRQGQVRWLTSACQEPQRPDVKGGNANALNGDTQAVNEYAAALEGYLQCLNKEATADLSAISDQVNQQLAGISAQAQAAVADLNNAIAAKHAP